MKRYVCQDMACESVIGVAQSFEVTVEPRDKWGARMIKIFSTYCTMMIQPEQTPVSILTGWNWLIAVITECLRSVFLYSYSALN